MADPSSLPHDDQTLAPGVPGQAVTNPWSAAGERTASANTPPACVVPGYEILGELGRGGMGVVYHAIETELKRPVALKIILAGAHAGQAAVARFRAEAEITARLRHAQIVQVYAVGDAGGFPFLALEYVDGGSLDRHLNGTPLPPRATAALVAQLADAMQVAHDAGIIHRDLKPGNVLLAAASEPGAGVRPYHEPVCLTPDSSPLTPKITDFGLAKTLEVDSGQTKTGAVLGTPSYMAPEQAEGKKEVGPAADIYALGAILYEGLTGRPPFKAATPLDTLLQVVSDEPVPPTRLQPKLPRDLETICLKCLHKDPRRRYATAATLAADLRHFLGNEPITARPVGAGERAWRWCQRKPAVAGLLTALGLLFLAAFATVTWLWLEAAHQRAEAQAERDRAKQQFVRAEANFKLARQAVDASLTQLSEEELLAQPGLSEVRKKLLATALRFYEEFTKQASDDPDVQYDRACAYHRMADIVSDIESQEKAIPLMREGMAIVERLLRDAPGHQTYSHLLAKQLTMLAGFYFHTEEYGQAETMIARALAVFQSLPPDYRDHTDVRTDRATAHSMRGRLLQCLARYEEAERDVKEYVRLAEQRLAEAADNPDAEFNLVSAYDQLAGLYMFMNREADCRLLHQKQQNVLEELTRRFPQRIDYTRALAGKLINYAIFLRRYGQPREALALYRQGCEILGQLLRKEPNDTLARQFLRNANIGMARTHALLDQHAESLPCWDKAIELEPGRYRDCLRLHRAGSLALLGRHAEAAQVWDAEPHRLEYMPDELFGLAETFATARVHVLQSDLPPSEKVHVAERYARWAEQCLQKSASQGYRDAERIRQHSGLRLLLGRPSLQETLKKMEGS